MRDGECRDSWLLKMRKIRASGVLNLKQDTPTTRWEAQGLCGRADGGESSETLSCAHDRAIVIINSEQLQMPALGLSTVGKELGRGL